MDFKRLNNIVGWSVFGIACLVYMLTAEPTGSLWDCGEFISSVHKLEVVHPPGAPLFLMTGRMFSFVADMVSDNPEHIAYAVNLFSGVCTAFLVLFIFWTTTMLSKLALVGRDRELDSAETIAVLFAGTVAGLSTTFASSVWFSAVEGEVYAMSGFFTGIVIWGATRWFYKPNSSYNDRWLVFVFYMIGLSIGVHLLSLLTIPYLLVLYYIKKYENHSFKGFVGALGAGVAILASIQYFIIPKLPTFAAKVDYMFVNNFGMSFGSGLIFFVILLMGLVTYLIYYTKQKGYAIPYIAMMCLSMVLIGFSTYGMIIIRAQANTPINMNNPSDPYTLVSYLNREQYGERPLLYGPHYNAKRLQGPNGVVETSKVYRPVGDIYDIVDTKQQVNYEKDDYMLFPRLGHSDRGQLYQRWLGLNANEDPTMFDNIYFFVRYQIGHMYWRYFMWNFAGKQNASQSREDWDKTAGNWMSGIGPLDSGRLYKQSELPESIKGDMGRNKYYFLPLIFGLLGIVFQVKSRSKEAFAVFILFIMTGLAIIVFSNQPPSEPRERDYVFAGSIFTFCIWIGMGALFLFRQLQSRINPSTAAIAAGSIAMTAPLIMGFQNWDDHSRADHFGARDYAINFLESCEPNAIIFTHGDNDTYPLWYAQEVEGIRPDVRVVNFSLLAVDWYINQLRRKVNKSEAIEMTIPKDSYRGQKRNVLYNMSDQAGNRRLPLQQVVKFMGENHNQRLQGGAVLESYIPTSDVYIPVNKNKARQLGMVPQNMPDSLISNEISFKLNKRMYIKDEIAMLDIIASNIWKRPIYFAVTCRPEKVGGLKPYLSIEGLALRIVPIKSASDEMIPGVLGFGSVDTERMYKNIMEDFRWGGFEKKKLFVDESYMPSFNAIQVGFIRLANELVQKKDTERASKLLAKYMYGFPHMNFPLNKNNSPTLVRLYYAANQEEGRQFMEQMAETAIDNLRFFNTLDIGTLSTQFSSELARDLRAYDIVDQGSKGASDQKLQDALKALMDKHGLSPEILNNLRSTFRDVRK